MERTVFYGIGNYTYAIDKKLSHFSLTDTFCICYDTNIESILIICRHKICIHTIFESADNMKNAHLYASISCR